MITNDNEARQRARHPIEIDNFADRYKTTSQTYAFTAPSLWVIEKNLFYLLKNSTQKQFNPKYAMRPDYLSYDEYGTVTLNQLLMFWELTLVWLRMKELINVVLKSIIIFHQCMY